jgi:hypothetical protein
MQMQRIPKKRFQVGCTLFFRFCPKPGLGIFLYFHSIYKMPDAINTFTCAHCKFSCGKCSNYTKHLLTKKHIDTVSGNNWKPKKMPQHKCKQCDRQYMTFAGLWKHNNKCRPQDVCDTPNAAVITKLFLDNKQLQNMCMEQLKENKELRELLAEHSKNMNTLCKEGTVVNHNHHTNMTTNHHHNNQKFNLNFFLNTTCKDAINMSDFIQTIEVQMNELENIGRNGYVAGMTDIILSRIKDLDVSKRPVHCTDLKREIMYVRDKNEWNKDTAEKSYLRKAIAMVSKKNYGKTMEWREHNPECLEVGSPKYDFCFKMMRNVLGDFEDIQIRMDNKIIKSLAKEVAVDR